MLRTHTNGELGTKDAGKSATLAGWVNKIRILGKVIFVDIKDIYGITQLVFNETTDKTVYQEAKNLKKQSLIIVSGKIRERENKNMDIATGEIEILVEKFNLINKTNDLPFEITDDSTEGEDLKMKYRFLDLRKDKFKRNFKIRHALSNEIRQFLTRENFIEIETPCLIKSTPEGARDFIVPSRMQKGNFYALPQSPQLFKQLLMIAGFDKYFQFPKCFRDEDLRADRQPEFTQLDCEMSFIQQEDILELFENLIRHLFKKLKNITLPMPFDKLTYQEAMDNYGCDKPDLRFEMKINDLTKNAKNLGFKLFDDSEYIGALKLKGTNLSRKEIDNYSEYIQKEQIGAKNLIYLKMDKDGELSSSIKKFITPEFLTKTECAKNDTLLILAGNKNKTLKQLSELRLHLANQLKLYKKETFYPLWVVDFPMFEWNEEKQKLNTMHHPFTSPKNADIELLEKFPEKVRANAYDLVINGVEIGGGSIRIHEKKLQSKIFNKLGLTEEEIKSQFGFLLNAFEYGAPPHGGIALGFDRLVSMFCGTDTIKDVIAFPKNNAGRDLMIKSPSIIKAEQLSELGIQCKNKKQKSC